MLAHLLIDCPSTLALKELLTSFSSFFCIKQHDLHPYDFSKKLFHLPLTRYFLDFFLLPTSIRST